MKKSNKHLLHVALAILITAWLPVTGLAECELILSCDNVERMIIAKSVVRDERIKTWLKGYALGVFFTKEHSEDLRTHLSECEKEYVTIKSKDMVLERFPTTDMLSPGWFSLARKHRGDIDRIVRSICPDVPVKEINQEPRPGEEWGALINKVAE